MRDDTDFLGELRKEIEAGKERRSSLVKAKLSFIVALLGAGSVLIGTQPNTKYLLYLTTLVVFIYDLYIIGEDFGIKRAGLFLYFNPSSPIEERRWEKTVSTNRDPVSGAAGLISSLFVLTAASIAMWNSQRDNLMYYFWIIINVFVITIIWTYGIILVRKLSRVEEYLKKEFNSISET